MRAENVFFLLEIDTILSGRMFSHLGVSILLEEYE